VANERVFFLSIYFFPVHSTLSSHKHYTLEKSSLFD
jgi:hypothetical protein